MGHEGEQTRGWLAEALSRRTRHPELEQTLFRRLQDLEHGPLEQLGGLVRHVIDELRIAQRRVAEQAADLKSLQAAVTSMAERLSRVETGAAASPSVLAPEPEEASAHVLMLSTATGYRLVERDGPPPGQGELVELDGGYWRVLRRHVSPLPGDRRPSVLALPE
jgi:hypothetical protein